MEPPWSGSALPRQVLEAFVFDLRFRLRFGIVFDRKSIPNGTPNWTKIDNKIALDFDPVNRIIFEACLFKNCPRSKFEIVGFMQVFPILFTYPPSDFGTCLGSVSCPESDAFRTPKSRKMGPET